MQSRSKSLPRWAVDLCQELSERLAWQVERGQAPWMVDRPFGAHPLPCEMQTGEVLATATVVQLAAAAQERGFRDRRWGTFAQIRRLGGHVMRGQKGVKVVRYGTIDGRLKTWRENLFNLGQARGLARESLASPAAHRFVPRASLDRTIEGSGALIAHQGSAAPRYDLESDRIVMPSLEQFRAPLDYYRTVLHEIGHWTGHPDRLNRETLVKGCERGVGSKMYAREELQAEIASMIASDEFEIGHDPGRHARYAGNWANVLREDPVDILRACHRAGQVRICLARWRERGRRQRPEQARGGSVGGHA